MTTERTLSHCLRCGTSDHECHGRAAMSGSWCCARCWHVGVLDVEHGHEEPMVDLGRHEARP